MPHPLVRTIPETGEKALFMGEHAAYLEGQPQETGRARLLLSEPLLALVPHWIARLSFPCAQEWADETVDAREDFRHEFRYDVDDALRLVASVAGARDTLRVIAERLGAALGAWRAVGTRGANGWQGVEAALYAVRCVAFAVPPDEAEVLPSIFSLLLDGDLPLLAADELRATTFRVVGRYAGWLAGAGGASPAALVRAATLVVNQGLLAGPSASGLAASADGAPPPRVALASSATECAARALSLLAAAAGGALDGLLLSLYARLHFPALQEGNAAYIWEALAGAVVSPPGNGEAHDARRAALAAAAKPLADRLLLLATNPAAALAVASADGSLAACLSSPDGEEAASSAARLGLDAGGAASLWGTVKANPGGGGALDVAAVSSALRPARAALALARAAVRSVGALADKLALAEHHSFMPPAARAAMNESRAAKAARSDADHGLLRSADESAREAARGTIVAALETLYATTWPAFEAALGAWVGGGGGNTEGTTAEARSSLLRDVVVAARPGFSLIGPNMWPHAARLARFIAGMPPAARAHAESVAAVGVLVDFVGRSVSDATGGGAATAAGVAEVRAALLCALGTTVGAVAEGVAPAALALLASAPAEPGAKASIDDAEAWAELLGVVTTTLNVLPDALLEGGGQEGAALLARAALAAAGALATAQARLVEPAVGFILALQRALGNPRGISTQMAAARVAAAASVVEPYYAEIVKVSKGVSAEERR